MDRRDRIDRFVNKMRSDSFFSSIGDVEPASIKILKPLTVS